MTTLTPVTPTSVTPTGAALAERFWQRVLFEVEAVMAEEGRGREGSPEQPLPFTVRRGLARYVLPPPADRLDDPRPASTPLDVAGLSTLLHHTYGLARLEVGRGTQWPLHRTVASARCFFPTELYCVIPSMGDLPAGAYVYDAAHHSLVAVRHGDAGAAVAAAVGPAASGAALILVLSTVYWRTAFMYRNYAYRLVTQEAGLVAGNAMLVAGALGLRGRLRHRFDQVAVERVLGVGWPDESVLSVLTLHPPGGAVGMRPATPRPGAFDERVPDPDRPAVDAVRCAHLLDLDAAARAEPAVGRLAAPAAPPSPAVADNDSDPPDLAEILRRRHSGGGVFNPLRRPVPWPTVARVVRHALDPYDTDATVDGVGPPVSCYVWTPSVRDTPPGVYRLVAGRLAPLTDGVQAAARLQELVDREGIASNVNYRTANLVAFVVADIAAGTRELGARSVRILSQEAGVVAHRICVSSAAESLAARIHNGYRCEAVAEVLGLPAGHAPLFQVIVGAVASTGRYQRMLGGAR